PAGRHGQRYTNVNTADTPRPSTRYRQPCTRSLASALLELADGSAAGIHHVAGPDALSRHQLGVLIAERDGLDASRLPTGQRADSTTPGPLDIRLDSQATQRHLRTRLRGAREFLR
ncbi:hypothetical protein ACF1HG_35355, partial [Streptomyces globisporus]